MKRLLLAAVLATATVSAMAADVGVSVSVGQPGFFGRIDIGDYPQPQVIYRQPVVVERVEVSRPPIYLRVPPSHSRNWKRHCREYNACGERVMFVQNNWYERAYVPRYQERHGHERREDRRDERQDDRRWEKKNDDKHGRGR